MPNDKRFRSMTFDIPSSFDPTKFADHIGISFACDLIGDSRISIDVQFHLTESQWDEFWHGICNDYRASHPAQSPRQMSIL
jgi:hypothetical protein